ncbi:hypothetical protein QA641_34915 [Bradyrhizobium sp. CB1650]|uniref:hypothetical protein n=1 Tax=Bradyrhizobium sp. CB1650 TaxID=3039153 RepID=UPI0024353516|nr:hypothetical protein [Bradyrhizobium sp. CB1650]WGD50738.1 hypothetical protein QA641_34915 [Bradyrhizobium sp. CB1650]
MSETELALHMIKTELGGRPNENTLRTFLLLAEHSGGGYLRDIERALKLSGSTVSRAVKFWTDRNFVGDDYQIRDLRRRSVRITWEGRDFHKRLKQAMETGTIPPPDPEPIETDEEPEMDPWLKKYLQSDEFKELERKDAEKRKREEAKRQEWLARREERRRNPKDPIDAYYNWMEQCPHPSGKKRKQWKSDNPMVFNGVTYVDHWSPQLSNSGKTTRWAGWLTGSDGSRHTITDEHINNRRNDPNRNWGLPE